MHGTGDLPLHFIESYGLAAMVPCVMLESLGLPLPGETAIIAMAGFAPAAGPSLWQVGAAAFVAAVAGDNVGYMIGRLGITEARCARAEAVARRYGPLMGAGARFFILLRQINGLVAGTVGMRWPVFLLANMAGAAVWIGLWTMLADRVGGALRLVPALWHHLGLVAAVAVPLVIGALLVLRLRRGR